MNKIQALALAAFISCTSTSTIAKQPSVTPVSATESVERININSASLEQLVSLKGIGEKKAKQIIAYREANGRFGSLEELMAIKGIGEKIIADNADRLAI